MSDERIRLSQVAASALAATTAALLGSTMGVAGTVIGAGVASVVSTIAGVLYLRSIQRTKESVRFVRSRVVTRAGSTTVTVSGRVREEEPGRQAAGAAGVDEADKPDEDQPDEDTVDVPTTGETADESTQEQPPARRRVWPVLVAGSLAAFVLGMGVITGLEWIRGEPLSGGEGTTLSKLIRTPADGEVERERTPPPATGEHSTPPSTGATETVTVTPTPEPTGEPSQPDDPPSGTTTPPETTTGGDPTGSVPEPAPPPSG